MRKFFLFFILLVFPLFSYSESAVFAGGCFWCMEPPFDKLDGVTSTTSGYIGGSETDAKYKKVSSGRTQHVEALKVEYDPEQISYEALLEVFWKNVDPFDDLGQFCDKGPHYKSYIYYQNDSERLAAEASLEKVKKYFVSRPDTKDEKIATGILERAAFYPAEGYHQDYYQKNPLRYKFYRTSCGRDKRLKAVWGG